MAEVGEFGFLTPERGGRQADGFFVDAGGHVLFWPDAEAPGYELAVEDADQLAAWIRQWHDWSSIIAAAVLLPLYCICRWAGDQLAPDFEDTVSGFGIGLVFTALAVAFLIPRYYRRSVPPRDLRTHVALRARRQVHRARPLVRHLKPSLLYGRVGFWLGAVSLAAVFLGLCTWVVIGEGPYGDCFLAMAAAFTLLAVLWKMWEREVTGLRPSEFASAGVLPAKGGVAVRDFNRLAWLILLGTPLVLAAAYFLSRPAPLTSEGLAALYMRTAFQSTGYIGSRAIKWTGVTSFCTELDTHSALRDTLIDRMRQTAPLMRMPIAAVPKSCAIEVAFTRGQSHRRGDAKNGLQYLFQQRRGTLYEVHLVLNPDSGWGRSVSPPVIDVAILRAMGMDGNLSDLANMTYSDRRGEQVPVADVLIAMHYDARIRAGMFAGEASSIAREIAREITESPSFTDWLNRAQL